MLALSSEDKNKIVQEIEDDFKNALVGIKKLPKEAKFGVYTAYKYYMSLLKRINKTQPEEILNKRIRVDDFSKLYIIGKSYVKYQLNYTL